ncbi:MAG: M56 family metallopeptidase [Candidatus Latescibacteria bacterium]|nr:M56 family metallopeptidase [Candidatus Latescibacterota bacterium]
MIVLFDAIARSGLPLTWLTLAWEVLFKGLCLLVVAGVCGLALRRASAAIRHLVWTATLSSLIALPVLSGLLPNWDLPGLPEVFSSKHETASVALPRSPLLVSSSDALPGGSMIDARATEAPRPSGFSSLLPATASRPRSWETWAFVVWLTGALAVLTRFGLGTIRLWGMTRRAQPIVDEEWIGLGHRLAARLGLAALPRMLVSDQATIPFTWGLWRSMVFFPREAVEWPVERRQIVLAHEFAHIKRRDCLTQMVAQVAGALYWFNPLVWLIARQHRIERERACDDQVLQSGTKASCYADALLEMARSLHRAQFGSFATVWIARRSHLEGRLLAILDPRMNRRGTTRWAILLVAVLGFGLVVPFATMHPTSRADAVTLVSDTRSPAQPAMPSSPVARHTMPASSAPLSPSAQPSSQTIRVTKQEADEEDSGDFIDEMESSGYRNLSVDQLVKLKMQGVTPAFIRQMRALGYDHLSTDALVALRIHGVTPAYVGQMKSVLRRNPTAQELVAFRAQNITPEFIRETRRAFGEDLSLDQIVKIRIADITPEFIDGLASVGFKDVPVEKLVSAKLQGVTPDYIRALQEQGYPNLSIDQYIKARTLGVTPEFIEATRARGFHGLSIDQLISLKMSGILRE